MTYMVFRDLLMGFPNQEVSPASGDRYVSFIRVLAPLEFPVNRCHQRVVTFVISPELFGYMNQVSNQ